MTTTMMPPDTDLPWFRAELQKRIGNPLVDIGVLPNAAHKAGGGYHVGSFDLKNIGKGIPPAKGKNTDYSARSGGDPAYYKFEISHGSNYASAMDVPGPWLRGGQNAWIRWNNYVVADLRADPNRIPGLREINFTPDGKVKRRFDVNNPGQGVISSTDTVLWHTHLGWWRNSILNRRAGFQRMLDLADDAIANRPARAIAKATPTTPTTSNPLLEELMQIVTVLKPPAGQKSINGKTLVDHSRVYLLPGGVWGLDDNNYGKFHNDKSYWDHSPEFTWDECLGIIKAMQPPATPAP
jgi:hypothetical protein